MEYNIFKKKIKKMNRHKSSSGTDGRPFVLPSISVHPTSPISASGSVNCYFPGVISPASAASVNNYNYYYYYLDIIKN